MIVEILGKRWQLVFGRLTTCDGICDPPSRIGKAIKISDRLIGELQLETIIHECLHAADWTKDEEFIEREARDFARILWRLGYRLETTTTKGVKQ